MLVIRDIMNCKPGQVKPMVEKFRTVREVMKGMGYTVRLMTDVAGERFWTVVAEIEVESLAAFGEMESRIMSDETAGKAMAGYHELVDHGRREIYRLEG